MCEGPSKAVQGRGRILGLDAGERRIGVALSDELCMLARPVTILDRRNGLRPVLDRLATLAHEEQVMRLVIGLPLNADGTAGRQARRAEEFARIVGRVLGLPFELWDERLSSVEAEAILREQGRNMKRARQHGIDAVAAALILQDYLDSHQPRAGQPGPEL
jgi:putative Holliday junction resolvase